MMPNDEVCCGLPVLHRITVVSALHREGGLLAHPTLIQDFSLVRLPRYTANPAVDPAISPQCIPVYSSKLIGSKTFAVREE